jgi:hypothetical protein
MAFNEDNKVVKATSTNTSLLSDVRLIVEQGLQNAYQGVNSVMVKTYWQVGRRIVEEEQQGEKRAEYGKQIITLLAEEKSFGQFVDEVNKHEDITMIYLAVDSDMMYKEMAKHFPKRQTCQLYRDYLDNFRINVTR